METYLVLSCPVMRKKWLSKQHEKNWQAFVYTFPTIVLTIVERERKGELTFCPIHGIQKFKGDINVIFHVAMHYRMVTWWKITKEFSWLGWFPGEPT